MSSEVSQLPAPRSPSQTVVDCFLNVSKVILVLTIVAKIITLAQYPKVLDLDDGVTGIRFYRLTVLAAVLEAAVLVLLFMRFNPMFKVLSVMYFSLITGAYRIVAHMADQAWCPCLGSFGAWASLNPTQVSSLLNLVVILFFTGSVVSIFLLWQALRTGGIYSAANAPADQT